MKNGPWFTTGRTCLTDLAKIRHALKIARSRFRTMVMNNGSMSVDDVELPTVPIQKQSCDSIFQVLKRLDFENQSAVLPGR